MKSMARIVLFTFLVVSILLSSNGFVGHASNENTAKLQPPFPFWKKVSETPDHKKIEDSRSLSAPTLLIAKNGWMYLLTEQKAIIRSKDLGKSWRALSLNNGRRSEERRV